MKVFGALAGRRGVSVSALNDHVHVYTVLMLILPSSVLCGLVPEPVNLTMDSHRFIHLLRWQAGPGSPAGLHYQVMFRSYKEGWKMVDSCGAVRYPLLCNLTDAVSNLDQTYYFNVTAVLGNETSEPHSYEGFEPVKDTVLELPSLRVSPCDHSLCVYLQSPSERLHTLYEKFTYTLKVTNELGVKDVRMTIRGLETERLKVVPGVQYCVSVIDILDRRFAPEPPVCASKPAAVNNMDAAISSVLCLLAVIAGVIVGLLALRSYVNLKTRQPLVLTSCKVPYKVQLSSWPTVESLKCVSVEPNMYKDVQVNDDAYQEKEDEEVAYEGRKGCKDVVCCEEISEGHSHNPVSETYLHVQGTFLKEQPDMITHHWDATTPQSTNQILTAHLVPLNTTTQGLIKNDDSVLLRQKTGDDVKQEAEEEDSDSVNFFSLTLGSHKSERQEETEKEEKMENVRNVKHESPLFVLESPKLVQDIQPAYFESTNKCISYSEEEEEEEEEDTEEEEAFSGYMMRS